MASIRDAEHRGESTDVDKRILRAAEACVQDVGIDRVTIAEVARRARVSRATVYRHWTGVHALLWAVFTRRVIDIAQGVPGGSVTDRDAIVVRLVAVVARMRHDPLVSAVLYSAPGLALSYFTERLGAGQLQLIELLAADLKTAQAGGTVRAGDTRQMAAMMILIAQSGVQSARIVEPILDEATLNGKLTLMLRRYLS